MAEDKTEASEVETIAEDLAFSAEATGVAPAGPTVVSSAQPELEKMSGWHIALLTLASFGGGLAFIVPLSYSLALQIDRLAPGHEGLLGVATGVASAIIVVTGPLTGMWSDRVRSRLGRRRPFMIAGVIIGLAALFVIGQAQSVLVVMVTWVFANFGWGLVLSAVQAIQADRIPDRQRGKASGLIGMTGQVAPIFGVALASALHGNVFLIFILPGIIGTVFIAGYLFFGGEASSVGMPKSAKAISARSIFAAYVFSPRAYPDFAWNLLGRFLFFLGLYANTAFSTFFYSQRLNLPVADVAGTAAIIGMIGVVAGALGAIGGGFLSDKLGRRKLFTAIGALLFALGASIEAFAFSFSALVVGSLIMNLAIAAFVAVDQAIVIAVLPSRQEAGRYMAIITFAQKIPSAIAPLLGAVLIGIGAVAGHANYTLLYLLGGLCALPGGIIVLAKVKAVR
ncbi:MFS transporter [Leifsonia sp. 2MCAF36]|uniref:MFS transporter n=1 Tax=Leifsonia sp. 2MCAF36 TaxID=3232988 RepID=UPI003F9D4522